MPQRNEIYGFEVIQAMRTRKRQARMGVIRSGLWWMTVIAIGFCAGLVITWMQASGDEPVTLRWLGYVVFAADDQAVDPGFYHGKQYATLINDSVEIGLRSDGVVVWRIKEEAKP